jgi:hypothetical protein
MATCTSIGMAISTVVSIESKDRILQVARLQQSLFIQLIDDDDRRRLILELVFIHKTISSFIIKRVFEAKMKSLTYTVLSIATILATSSDTTPGSLGLCQSDCDRDADCQRGLWCADDHKDELRKAGLDERKANCGKNTGDSNLEVCFVPAILNRNSSGFGGM